MRGRRPKPDVIGIADGTQMIQPQLEFTGQPVIEGIADSTPPFYLNGEGLAEWNRISKCMVAAGTFTDRDRTCLATHCQIYTRWVEAIQQIEATGQVIASPTNQPQINPWVSIANECTRQMRPLMSELGLTPSARSRVHSVPTTAAKSGGVPKRNRA